MIDQTIKDLMPGMIREMEERLKWHAEFVKRLPKGKVPEAAVAPPVKTEATPGPWYWWWKDEQIVEGPEAKSVVGGFAVDGVPNNADLALILAAPELLAACRKVIEDNNDQPFYHSYDHSREALAACAAAIAKAEGR